MDTFGEHGVQGKLPPARRHWRGWERQIGDSLQVFKMPEERDELFFATSKTRTKTTEKIKKKKARIWHNKELSGGLWRANERGCCNK